MGIESKLEKPIQSQEIIEEEYSDEKAIEKCLESGRLGYDEISVLAVDELFRQAPEGKIFQVPNDIRKTEYEHQAKANKRGDVRFEIGK